MHQSFDDIKALLPVYFDRVQAFSTPFYGFDVAALWERGDSKKKRTEDWNTVVAEFLRRQERLGGPPTAVALILDAVGTSNLHSERGFRLASATSPTITATRAAPNMKNNTSSGNRFEGKQQQRQEEPSPDDNAWGVQWPAVYLRSTLHLSTSSSSGNSNVRASPRSSGLLRGSQGSLLAGWSSSSNVSSPKGGGTIISGISPAPSSRKQSKSGGAPHHHHYPSIFEYAPDTGTAVSWPHSDWESLVMILDKHRSSVRDAKSSLHALGCREGAVATYRYGDDEEAVETGESASSTTSLHDSVDEVASFFSIHRAESSGKISAKKQKRQSTFYVVSMGVWLDLVVMVKEEESRWHLRRNRLEDGEIRDFLADLARKLCISKIVSAESLKSLASEKDKPMISLPRDNILTWTDEKRVQDFLADLKEVFGLRPISPLHDSFYGMGRQSPRTPVNPRASAFRRRRLLHQNGSQVSLPESAAALFLGPELATLFS